MKSSDYLPIVAALGFLVAACSPVAAQGRAGDDAAPRNATQRTASPTRIRVQAPTSEQTALPLKKAAVNAHHKSWKDRARGKTEGKTDRPLSAFSPWSACGALAVVVGLILILARLFRRHAPIFSHSLPREALEILGRRHVDPRQTILLVRIGARILVVGSSASGLNPLGQIDDPVEVDLLAGLCRRESQPGVWGSSFFTLLKGETKTRPASNPVRTVPQAARAARGSTADFPSVMPSLDSETENLSQREQDLVRRLRGTHASRHAEAAEGVP
jgi:flagellar biogenesis protein FliO